MLTNKQQKLLEELQNTAQQKHWTIVGQRDIDHAVQYYIKRGKDEARISLHTKGGIIVQGKEDSQLRKELETWRDQQKAAKPLQSTSLWEQ